MSERTPELLSVVAPVYNEVETHLIDTLKGFTSVRVFEKFANLLGNYFSKVRAWLCK